MPSRPACSPLFTSSATVLYEQYLPGEHFGAPVGEAPSLGLHESQARLVENHLGRSRPFWRHLWPRLAPRFGAAFAGITADDVWRAVNHPRRDPDRITADELSYDLHIHIRVDLERALVGGALVAAELPGAAEAYRQLLGITPPNDVAGCLQDGHWAEGMFGFFPTYTVGNAIAAQLMQQLRGEMPALDDALGAGDPERAGSCASTSTGWAASSPPRRWSSGPPARRCRSSP